MNRFIYALLLILPLTLKSQTPDSVCYNSTFSTYYVTNTPGYSYSWTVTYPGSIVSGQGTNQIEVDWALANQGFIPSAITVFATSSDGCVGPPVSLDVFIQCAKQSAIFFPNAFTPNGDGVNDGWSPIPFKISEMRWQIFNRFGQKVYETSRISDKWNGVFKGEKQPIGNFVFQCWWKALDGKSGYNKGNVLLIR